MQTFLPYPDFARSAAVLDDRRLGKQRVECMQIYRALADPTYGWQSHPAVKMWRDHTAWLCAYWLATVAEWVNRGFKNSIAVPLDLSKCEVPPWLGDPALHASHRSNLLRKDPAWYGQFGWTEPPDLPYVWPIKGGSDVSTT